MIGSLLRKWGGRSSVSRAAGRAVLVLALAGLPALPGSLRAQGFSLPEGALTPITQFQLNYRTVDAESTTEVSGVEQEQTSTELEGAAAFVGIAIDPVIFGASGDINDFHTETTTFNLDEMRHTGTGFVTLGLGAVALVLSSSQFAEESEVEELITGNRISLRRRMELDTDAQLAVFVRLPFFRFGYARDNRRLSLEFETAFNGTPVSVVEENYSFGSETLDFALILEGRTGPFLTGRRAHSEAEEAQGEVFDFSGATEDIEVVSVGWRFGPREAVAFVFRHTRLEFGFEGVTDFMSEETSRTVAVDLAQGMSLEVTQAEETTRNRFVNAGGLESIESVRNRTQVGIGWRF